MSEQTRFDVDDVKKRIALWARLTPVELEFVLAAINEATRPLPARTEKGRRP